MKNTRMFCCYAPNWNLIKQSKSLQPCQPQHCGQLHDCFSYSFNAGKIMVLGTRIVMVFVVESLFCNHSLAHIRIVQSGHEKWWKNKMKSKAKQKFICMQIKRMLMLIRVNKRFKMYKHILLVCDVGVRMCVVHAVQRVNDCEHFARHRRVSPKLQAFLCECIIITKVMSVADTCMLARI